MCNSCTVQRDPAASRDDVVDAVLGASRVLVAVAARSLAGTEDQVTLPQYRALVVLASRGPQRVTDLAQELEVHTSTATRMCERLTRKELIRRDTDSDDRRTVHMALTDRGRALIDEVTARRRRDLARLVRRVPVSQRGNVVRALQSLTAAAGEVPEQDWSTGWDL
jgi:DNA-binding MarR family transcriptional regulator